MTREPVAKQSRFIYTCSSSIITGTFFPLERSLVWTVSSILTYHTALLFLAIKKSKELQPVHPARGSRMTWIFFFCKAERGSSWENHRTGGPVEDSRNWKVSRTQALCISHSFLCFPLPDSFLCWLSAPRLLSHWGLPRRQPHGMLQLLKLPWAGFISWFLLSKCVTD